MAHLQYLIFNEEDIPKPVSYYIDLYDVEADSGGITEAGTVQRDVVREGMVRIHVIFHVSKRWLGKLAAYKKLDCMSVGYLEPETMETRETDMYIDDYRSRLVCDTSYGGLWEVSFTLKEF